MDLLNGVGGLALYTWLGVCVLIFLWFGSQCVFLYWNMTEENSRFLTGKKRYSYYVGALIIWAGFITLIPMILYGLGRLWLYLLGVYV